MDNLLTYQKLKPFYLLSFFFFCFSFFMPTGFAQVGKSFEPSEQFYIQGNSILIGNNILSQHKEKPIDDFRPINDLIDMVYVNVDNDESTFSSSQASILETISGKQVKYAALYWSAIYKYDKGKKSVRRKREVYEGNDVRSNDIHLIKFKAPGENYINIEGNVIFDSFHSDFFEETKPYVCYANITSHLKNLETIDGIYTLANIKATQGFISGGSAGGWLLYIVYEDETQAPKSFATFNGLMEVSNASGVDMVFKDFMPVESGEINTSLLIGALEGDHRFKTDMVYLRNNNQKRYVPLSNSIRPSDNFFNSTISIYDEHFTNRNPASLNTLGFDLLKIKIPDPKNKIILNETSELPVRFTTRTDRYYLFFVGFETEISNDFFAQKTGFEIAKEPKEDVTTIEDVETAKLEIAVEISPKETINYDDPDKLKISQKLSNQAPIKMPELKPGYYLVTNVFSKKINAENWKKYLIDQGFNPGSFKNSEKNWEYIYIDFDTHPNLLIDKAAELSKRNDLQDIWILKINN